MVVFGGSMAGVWVLVWECVREHCHANGNYFHHSSPRLARTLVAVVFCGAFHRWSVAHSTGVVVGLAGVLRCWCVRCADIQTSFPC